MTFPKFITWEYRNNIKLKPTIKSLIWATVTITLHYQHLKFYTLLISLLNVAVSKTQNPQSNVTCRYIKEEAKP